MKKSIIIILFVLGLGLHGNTEKPVVAVLDFYSDVLSEDELTSISSRLSSELLRNDQYILVEVSQRDTIIEEMAFSLSGFVDENQALEIGAMLSAEALVMGTVALVDDQYVISAKLVETTTGEILRSTEDQYKSINSLLTGLRFLARDLSGTTQLHQRRSRAFTAMGGGVLITGGSLFFLINGSQKISAVNAAWEDYNSMTSGDFDKAYNDYLDLHQDAQDSMANLQFMGGIGGTVLGVGLMGLSTWMLLSPLEIDNPFLEQSNLSLLVLPAEDSVSLAFGLSY